MSTPSTIDRDGPISSEELEQQVWAWLRRLTSTEASVAELRAFETWVQAHPAHRAAYQNVKRVWDTLKPAAGQVKRDRPGVVADYLRGQRTRRHTRRAFFGMATATAAAAGVAVLYPPFGLWRGPAEWNADYHTGAGEQRTVAMAEGVEVTLNTRTSVRSQIEDGRTVGLDLLAGETAIDLRDGHRFAVKAGVGQSLAGAGRMEVRYLGETACVTCLAGTVEVRHPAATRQLVSGQQTRYDAHAIGEIARIDPEQVSAWRRGLLVFHQARLQDAIAEINRYWPGRIVLANSAAGEQRVSGTFRIATPEQAVAQLQYMFGLRARSLGGVMILT